MSTKVALELFHGRARPDQDLDAWGTQGPVFLVDYVHVTYLCDIKLGIDHPNGDGDLRFIEDLVYYDGVYYGDWSVFSLEIMDDELRSRIQEFDHSKAEPPERKVQ